MKNPKEIPALTGGEHTSNVQVKDSTFPSISQVDNWQTFGDIIARLLARELHRQLLNGNFNGSTPTGGLMQKEFKEAMRNNAIFCPIDIVADGEVHRFSNKGERNQNGWYVLHENAKGSYGGAYGDWKIGKTYKWSSSTEPLSRQQKQDVEECIKKTKACHEKETSERQESASVKASEIWKELRETGTSPYLKKKQVKHTASSLDTLNPPLFPFVISLGSFGVSNGLIPQAVKDS